MRRCDGEADRDARRTPHRRVAALRARGGTLTAFAQGLLPEPRRRGDLAPSPAMPPLSRDGVGNRRKLFDRLRSFSAAPLWRGELGAAVAGERVRRRARGVGAMAGAGVGLLLATGIVFLPTGPMAERHPARCPSPPPPPPDIPEAASPPSDPARAPPRPLRRGPRPPPRAGGRTGAGPPTRPWGPGRHDEAATGLGAPGDPRRHPHALRDPSVARAVAAATRWLKGRERALDASPATFRDDAVATSALLEVYAQTGDVGVRASADRGVRRLARELASGAALDPASAGWGRLALARARDLGWDRAPATGASAPTTYPLGGTPGETLVAKALALVDRSPQG